MAVSKPKGVVCGAGVEGGSASHPVTRWDALTVWGLSRDGAVLVVAHVPTLPLLMLENEVVLLSLCMWR